MLLNLIVFKFVPGILKCLDVWRMSFSCFFLFSIVNLYSSIYKKKKSSYFSYLEKVAFSKVALVSANVYKCFLLKKLL